jgi:hypothetical protein
VTIEKGQPWGHTQTLPADGVVVTSDAEARAAVEQARAAGAPLPVLGLTGGDLCRTLGGRGDEARLRSADAVTFPIDVGHLSVGERGFSFVAHLIAHSRSWARTVAVLNAAWLGPWNAAPRSHPNDGALDVFDAHLRLAELRAVRARLPQGAHLPHPRIGYRRLAAVEIPMPRRARLWLDGRPVPAAAGEVLRVTVEPDALRVVV